jgi:type I restriction enzyme S subunit
MKSSYKPIGNYIHKVENRNRDLKVTRLLGLSMTKEFRETTSNTVGTDMSVYKVMSKYQFACDFMSPIRVNKLPVVLKLDDEPNLVSPAYPVFEIKDKNDLDPEYLMMWFRRSEFDRYATFKCDAAIRGGYEWTELCETLIPIPSITKQREIVKEYNVIQNCIALNQKLIQKLQESVHAIYKQWFLEFDFPNEEGKPYKSSGGEMVESELGEIPKGWEVSQLSSLCQITSSKRIFESEYKKEGVPFYRAGEIKQKKEGVTIKELLYISEDKFLKISKSFGHPLSGDILLTAVGSLLGDSYLVENETFYFKDGNVIWFRRFVTEGCNLYLYEYLQSENFRELLAEIKIGSGQSAITIQSLNEKRIVKPNDNLFKKYNTVSSSINSEISQRKKQNSKLYELKDLILSKLATIEN